MGTTDTKVNEFLDGLYEKAARVERLQKEYREASERKEKVLKVVLDKEDKHTKG